MIEVDAYKTFDQAEWSALIMNVDGNSFHLPDVWLVDNNPEKIRYLILKKHRDIIGACVALYQERRFLRLFNPSRTLYFPTFPAISEIGAEGNKHILDVLVHFAAKEGFDFLKIGLRWGADLSYPGLDKFIDGRLTEFTIDLRYDISSIKSGFHKKHRKNIRKASEQNIEIIKDNSLDGFMKLKELQKSSSARSSAKGNVYDIQNEGFYIKTYQHVYKRGLGNVIFVKKDGKYVAGLAYLFFNNKAITVRSGVMPEGYVVSAPYYLQYELIRQLKEEGCKIINIGGVPEGASDHNHPQHGLYQFKKGFGSIINLRTGLTIPVS